MCIAEIDFRHALVALKGGSVVAVVAVVAADGQFLVGRTGAAVESRHDVANVVGAAAAGRGVAGGLGGYFVFSAAGCRHVVAAVGCGGPS